MGQVAKRLTDEECARLKRILARDGYGMFVNDFGLAIRTVDKAVAGRHVRGTICARIRLAMALSPGV